MIQKFRRRIAIAFFSILLVSCEQNELTVPIPAIPSGGSYSAPSRSIPTPPKAPPAKGGQNFGSYTHDPENDEWAEEEEPVVADSLEEARRKCRQLESKWGLPLDDIKAPSRKGGKTYRCFFRGYRPR